MSRWIDQFKAHPFNAQWDRIRDGLSKAKVDDETIVTDVKELARLRKVVSYLDGMIRGVDPELVPLETWNNFNTQADACAAQIEAYNSNRNIGHIQSANNHTDNLLTYLRPYMVGETVARNAAQSSLNDYFDTFIGYIESFKDKAFVLLGDIEKDKTESHGLYNSINNFKADIDGLKRVLFDSPDGIKWEVEKMASEAADRHSQISGVYNEVVVGNDERPSTKLVVQQARELIEKEKDRATNIVDSVEEEVSDIKKFHGRVFGEKNDQGEHVGGISGSLNELMQKLNSFDIAQRLKYEAIVKEIEGLLPGAISAGLASAYLDMRKSFDGLIANSGRIFYWSLFFLFISSIPSAIHSFSSSPFEVVFSDLGNWEDILKSFAHRLPLYVPVLWLAFYASKRRSEFQRLQQEYAHKEAIAKSYIGFKKQIDELDDKDKEMLKKLIDSAINAVSYNASVTLDGKHGDKMPIQEMLEKSLDFVKNSKDLVDGVAKKVGSKPE